MIPEPHRKLRPAVAVFVTLQCCALIGTAQPKVPEPASSSKKPADQPSAAPAAATSREPKARQGDSGKRDGAAAADDQAGGEKSAELELKPEPSKAEDPQLARVLFEEGRKLVQQGNYEEACRTFEKSLRFQDGVGTKFNLADCWERTGRSARAYTLFLEVAADSAGQPDRERVARERAEALRPKLSFLQIDAAEPGVSVTRNGAQLAAAEIGEAVAVEPGAFHIVASAPIKRSWSVRLRITASPGTTTVTVPKLMEKDAPLAALEKTPSRAVTHRPSASTLPPRATGQNRTPTTQRTLAFVVGGAGVASLAAGAWMALRYRTANDDAKDICPSSVNCTSSEIERHSDLVDEAKTSRTLAFVGAGVGAGALAVASYLYVRSLNSGSTLGSEKKVGKAPVTPVPVIGTDGTMGAVLSGHF